PMRRFRSAFASVNRHRRARIACRPNPAPTMRGSKAIGTRKDRAISGTTATGRIHRTKARTGSSRTTLGVSISQVIGKAIAATSPTTTAGTERDSGTNVAILLPTIAIATTVTTTVEVTVAAERDD